MRIVEADPSVAELVKANGGYCPCAILKTPETKCMCAEFKAQKTPGPCHCGRFVKTEE